MILNDMLALLNSAREKHYRPDAFLVSPDQMEEIFPGFLDTGITTCCFHGISVYIEENLSVKTPRLHCLKHPYDFVSLTHHD